MYSKAKAHFKKTDPRLHAAALRFDIPDVEASGNLFREIVRTIIGQQLSGKAADTIFGRFAALFPRKAFTAKKILAMEESALRSAGLSGAKARAIRNFAERVAGGDLDLKLIPTLEDARVIEELSKVKGIGPWTAEMILMFSLGRADVFSGGDLGLARGAMRLYGLRGMPDAKKLEKLSKAWAPWRTYAARVLWRIADGK